MKKLPTSIAVIVALSLAGAAAAAPKPKAPPPGPTQITDCQDITESDSYVLVNNLTATGASCIRVGADSVTIDLAGFTIEMVGASSGFTAGIMNDIGTASFSDGLTVLNGTIKGFSSGIRIEGGIGHRIEGVRVSGNAVEGIAVLGAGFLAVSGIANVVKDNVAVGNGTDPVNGVGGIVFTCPSVITGNVVVANGPIPPGPDEFSLLNHIVKQLVARNTNSQLCTFADNVPNFDENDFPGTF